VANVNEAGPTPEQARAAVAEADSRAVGVRRSDAQLRNIVLTLAAMYLAMGVAMGFLSRGGSPVPFLVVLSISTAGVALILVLVHRVRAYTRPGFRRFAFYAGGFAIWSLTVLEVGIFGGWFGGTSPAWHFTVAAAVGSIPLLVGGLLLTLRGRQA
jgi:hypothetical protein